MRADTRGRARRQTFSARLTEENGMSTQDAARAVVIVTGAGKGIGAASARRLAREGWRVVAADTDGAAAARVAAEIHGLAAKAEVGVAAAVADLVAPALAGY